MTELRLVYVTTESAEHALTIGRAVVEAELASCINVLPRMVSVYRWEGQVQEAEEAVLLIKTTADRVEGLRAFVVERHSYECPCIIDLPVMDGHPQYLQWLGVKDRHSL